MSKRGVELYLGDIKDSIRKIEKYTHPLNFTEFFLVFFLVSYGVNIANKRKIGNLRTHQHYLHTLIKGALNYFVRIILCDTWRVSQFEK